MNRPTKCGHRRKPNRHARDKQPKGYYAQLRNPDHFHPRSHRLALAA